MMGSDSKEEAVRKEIIIPGAHAGIYFSSTSQTRQYALNVCFPSISNESISSYHLCSCRRANSCLNPVWPADSSAARPRLQAVRTVTARDTSLNLHLGLIWALDDLRETARFEKRSQPFIDRIIILSPADPSSFCCSPPLISQTMKKILCQQGRCPAESKLFSCVCVCLPAAAFSSSCYDMNY